MKLIFCFLTICFASLCICTSATKPDNYAYLIVYNPYHENNCEPTNIVGISAYPVYGNNGTCLKGFYGHYTKAVCSDDHATIYTSCSDSNCQNCKIVYNWQFEKNRCGIQAVGCSRSLPKFDIQMLYTYSFDSNDRDCSGKIIELGSGATNFCYPSRVGRYSSSTCNETTWTSSNYYEGCSPSGLRDSQTGPTNVCVKNEINICV